MLETWMDRLKVFQGFSQEQLGLLRPLFSLIHFPAGTALFQQGDPTECFYILASGEIAVRYKPEDGPALNVTHVRSEAVVGWSAAIGAPYYTSSAICTMDCQVLQVKRGALRQLCESDPETGSMFLERLAGLIEVRLGSKHPQLMALLEQGLSVKYNRLLPAS